MPNKVNIQAFIDSLEKQYLPRLNAALASAVYGFGVLVISEAQTLCPVDTRPHAPHTGALRRSAYTGDVEGSGTKLHVTIGFNAEYAVFVHEVLTAFHPVGENKFLSKAMQRNAPKFLPFVAEKINEEFSK